MTARSLRMLRGWTAAAVATGGAVLAHTVAGGPWPSPLLVLLCMALSAPVCMLLAGLRLPRIGLILSVAVSQLLFHGLFSMSGSMTAAVDHTSHAGHLTAPPADAGPDLVLQSSTAVHVHGQAHRLGPIAGDWLMPALHITAAILTILILRHGERLALRLAATLLVRAGTLIARIDRAATAPRPRWRPRPADPVVPRWAQVVLACLRYRGPPVVAAV